MSFNKEPFHYFGLNYGFDIDFKCIVYFLAKKHRKMLVIICHKQSFVRAFVLVKTKQSTHSNIWKSFD